MIAWQEGAGEAPGRVSQETSEEEEEEGEGEPTPMATPNGGAVTQPSGTPGTGGVPGEGAGEEEGEEEEEEGWETDCGVTADDYMVCPQVRDAGDIEQPVTRAARRIRSTPRLCSTPMHDEATTGTTRESRDWRLTGAFAIRCSRTTAAGPGTSQIGSAFQLMRQLQRLSVTSSADSVPPELPSLLRHVREGCPALRALEVVCECDHRPWMYLESLRQIGGMAGLRRLMIDFQVVRDSLGDHEPSDIAA